MPGRPTRLKRMTLVGLAVVALLAGACGGDDDDDAASEAPAARPEIYGRAADPGEATRTIELKMTDELTFEPASINVDKGEIITFKVTNVGAMAHEITIGGEDSQILHEAQMLAMTGDGADMEEMEGMDHAEMGHDEHGGKKDAPSTEELAKLDKKAPAFKSLHLEPGQTGELTWSFEGEPPLIGCHLPGHYDGGMKGEIVYA